MSTCTFIRDNVSDGLARLNAYARRLTGVTGDFYADGAQKGRI